MKSLDLQRTGKSSQQGFTIIELVVVILLLGILAATALPRFINVTAEAHQAAFDGVVGGLATGNALIRAEYVGKGGTGASVASYPGITVSTGLGYPVVSSGATCVSAFDNLLQGGHPTIGDIGTDAISATLASTDLSGVGTDFGASYDVANSVCQYVYLPDVDSLAAPAGAKAIFVNAVNGDVTTGNL